MYYTQKLNRFLIQQEGVYSDVVSELRSGEKRTHWMWYIFPKIKGLGRSNTNNFYSIESLEEAKAYAAHEVLGKRLIECSELVYRIHGRRIEQIVGIDDVKLRSSMTLFAIASPETMIFSDVLKKYFNGINDGRTLEILGLV